MLKVYREDDFMYRILLKIIISKPNWIQILKETDIGDRCCSIELNDVANGVIANSINAYKGE